METSTHEQEDPMDCDEAPLRMVPASCYMPDHDEDAHFIHAASGVIGVADGVGGCRGLCADAAAFSRGLMAHAHALLASSSSSSPQPVCPYTLLDRAYHHTVDSLSRTPTLAASTAVILSLSGAVLRFAYVGDSGFAVFRGGRILHRSRPQQSYFNCPYQLSAHGTGGNRVRDAAVGQVPVAAGDVVVAGSDGLFDNLFDSGMERIVQLGAALRFPARTMADFMASHAYSKARSRTEDSPFSAACREQGVVGSVGGKMDDITVVVAYIE
ncbi:putative protein phosphatase 2C 24 [Brachypodium distachyon]|uniref:Protein phosphatase n=1 Tax=Brachypodium distachyon TaxID=15368 RepID=I1IAN4_BRADI|nr:putative protein phosphatase 2C 24 [Brachypodium distachyon]KQJ99945.1 hypothetical protein BRADI_3g46160v3 [Brachypodium distachyon]|eukprot:XP_003572633.1 putative protein phosphatase 2C 24 [Brachypodium distachyon]